MRQTLPRDCTGPENSRCDMWFLYFCVIPVFRFCIKSGGKPKIVMFAYNLGHFWLTSIQLCRFAAFFNSLFSFYFGVISCICTKFCCFEFWRQNDDKPEIQLSAVNSDCFPVHCGLEGEFGAWIRQILIRFIRDSYIFARFRYFEFRVASSGEETLVYVVYCVLRYSDVIPVIRVIPVFVYASRCSHNKIFRHLLDGRSPAYFQSRDYDAADTVDFVAVTGDKVEVDFVATVYAALNASAIPSWL